MTQKYMLSLDTESNGFVENATTLWTFCAKDLRTGKRFSFGGPEGCYPYREDIQSILSNSDVIICHNEIKHDLPLMAKLGIADRKHWGKAKIIDTFVMSSLLNPDRPAPAGCRSGHSLEAYAILSGGELDKVQQETWDTYDPNMMKRCESDVDITEYAYRYLCSEIAEDKWDWKQPFDLETKVAFIIAKQERDGWQFDTEKALELVKWIDNEVEVIDKKLVPMLPPVVIPEEKARKFPTKKFTKAGEPTSQALKYWADEVEGFDEEQIKAFLRSDATNEPKQFIKPRNPGSQEQMKEYLLTVGWEPTQWTEKGSPKLTEDSLDSIQGEAGTLFARRAILTARRGLLLNTKDDEKGLINKVRPDGRIAALANPCATPTGRMRHKNVVNIPAARSDLGPEIRSLFCTKKVPGTPIWTFERHGEIITVDDGSYAQVGCDAAGLELRNLASRMNDKDYIEKVVNGKKEDGTDVHTFTLKLLSDYIDTRDDAKNILYAFMYGAGDEKLGKMCARGHKDFAKRGKEVREAFLRNIPALDDLVSRVKKVSKRGFLKGLDGRKIWVRSEHAALNSLLQCDGAVVMKVALVELYKAAMSDRLDFKFVGNIHDEIQAEVYPLHAKQFAQSACNSIADAGKILGMACPLAGEAQIGLNWADCH